MAIANPRRILAVSLEDASIHLSKVVKDLTGSPPEPASATLAGTSHTLSLKTAYYEAEVPIWLDLISSPADWSSSFLSAEAKEVLDVLGGLVIVFTLPVKPDSEDAKSARELISNVGKVLREGLGGWGWDGVGLCLGIGEVDDVDEWEDSCAESGLEFVQIRGQPKDEKNEFGEKTGMPRVLEALEANEWSLGLGDLDEDFDEFEDPDADNDKDEDEGGSELDPEALDFGFDRADFAGLKRAIWDGGKEGPEDFLNGEPSTKSSNTEALDEEEVQKLERMMRKLSAVRDMSAGLPEDQRKRLAARAVGEVMKEL